MSGRVALGVEYDGAPFSGWQSQRHAPSVQETLEKALSRVADHPVEAVCAGRTDAGVHATHQVVHFDTTARRPMHAWVLGANALMPGAVSALWAQPVSTDFHARYSATRRAYRYVFFCRRSRPALLRRRVAWVHRPMDAGLMQKAARPLLGEHDFSAFRAAACQSRHARRRLLRLEVFERGPFIYLDVEANAFLHHMVRNLAGTLMAVGRGERPVEWPAEVLAGRDRTSGGITAPAEGLYLTRVVYPPAFGLPERGVDPLFA